MIAMNRWGVCLILIALPVACSAVPEIAPPLPVSTPTPALPPTPTVAPSMTASASSTSSPTSSLTPLPTDTPTASLTPTTTPLARLYVFPVQAPRDVGFSEGGHAYPATDIFAPFGARFVAVTDGVVNFVSTKDVWNPKTNDPNTRGGLSVAIVGDDGVRYYGAHLSAIAPGIQVGVRVKAGQLLGYVGNSGDAAHKETHLHFGISPPTYPQDWHSRRGLVDPYPYLVAWRAGVSVTPVLANIDLTTAP